MTVHFYNKETKEYIHIKADIYVPGVDGLLPHKVLQDGEIVEFDADRYTLSYIGM